MQSMKVKEVMANDLHMVQPAQSVKDAAEIMRDLECGILPVGSPGHIVGMITDRDIAIRLTAEGKDPAKTEVNQIMSKNVYSCDEDDAVEEAAERMLRRDVGRLIVMKDGKVTGIVTLASMLRANGDEMAGKTVLHALLGSQCALDIDKWEGKPKKLMMNANGAA